MLDRKRPSFLYEDDIETVGNTNVSGFSLLPTDFEGELRYRIIQKQILEAKGNQVVDSETLMIWNIQDINVYQSHFVCTLLQEKHEIIKTHDSYKEISSILQLFNYPIARLVLKCSLTGQIEEVVNQAEVNERWQQLKTEQLSQFEETAETRVVLESGDKDFSNSLPMLQNSPLYRLLFPKIYGKKISSAIPSAVEKKGYNSNLFTNKSIPIQTNEKSKLLPNNKALIEHIGKSVLSEELKEKMLDLYQKQYEQFIEQKLSYNYTLFSEYQYDLETNILQKLEHKAREEANSNLFHLSTYTITLITDENE